MAMNNFYYVMPDIFFVIEEVENLLYKLKKPSTKKKGFF